MTDAESGRTSPHDAMHRPTPNGDRLGTVALVLGVLAILTVWAGVGLLFAIAALVVGYVAVRRVRDGRASNRSRPLLGITLGVLTLAVGAALVFFGAVQSDNGCWPVKQHTGCY